MMELGNFVGYFSAVGKLNVSLSEWAKAAYRATSLGHYCMGHDYMGHNYMDHGSVGVGEGDVLVPPRWAITTWAITL